VVSLHAITGIRREDTMQRWVVLNGQELLALLDTGSTHNFINCKAAQQCGVTLEPTPGCHVKVANGEPVFCQGVTRRAAIDIKREKFTIEAYAIPLDTFEIILGTAFLRTLRLVLWDLQDLCMAFWHEGRRILWKGLGSV
jgi:predicted aspartyl protease